MGSILWPSASLASLCGCCGCVCVGQVGAPCVLGDVWVPDTSGAVLQGCPTERLLLHLSEVAGFIASFLALGISGSWTGAAQEVATATL